MQVLVKFSGYDKDCCIGSYDVVVRTGSLLPAKYCKGGPWPTDYRLQNASSRVAIYCCQKLHRNVAGSVGSICSETAPRRRDRESNLVGREISRERVCVIYPGMHSRRVTLITPSGDGQRRQLISSLRSMLFDASVESSLLLTCNIAARRLAHNQISRYAFVALRGHFLGFTSKQACTQPSDVLSIRRCSTTRT